jgi:hypothetical protein
MIEIDLKPTLLNCVQTMAKREYEATLGKLLKEDGKSNTLEEKLELLKMFLESTNFGKLRSEYESFLRDGKTVTIKLRAINGRVEYEQL